LLDGPVDRFAARPAIVADSLILAVIMAMSQPYTAPVCDLLSLGDPREADEESPDLARDFAQLGVTAEHIPELIRMTTDKPLHQRMPDDPALWGRSTLGGRSVAPSTTCSRS